MVTFNEFWQMLRDNGSSNYYQNEVYVRWERLAPEAQQKLYKNIRKRLDEGRFVNYNPLEAMHDNMPRQRTTKQVLSYIEYYSTFHTTTPKDGWRMEKGGDGKVFYTKTEQP